MATFFPTKNGRRQGCSFFQEISPVPAVCGLAFSTLYAACFLI
ncbi:hypothetical protein HMPREF1548_02349 [Clostridium sp. KLE 1755]|nr:hypothetical protein HMPREF1548_02349 [Clostridium sp. KLE 1755]